MMNRRSLLKGVGDALAGTALAKFSLPFDAHAEDVTSLPFANGERPLARYPGKRPLIRSTSRPPQLETPFAVFNEGAITPNDAFYVRYHLISNPDPDSVQFGWSASFQIRSKSSAERSVPLDNGRTVSFLRSDRLRLPLHMLRLHFRSVLPHIRV